MQTENRSQKIAVTGATGRVGSHLVEILEQRGHDVVPIARSKGVDVVSGEGLDEALAGVETIIDTATGPSPDQEEATAFFTASARNLQRAGAAAGAKRIVVVSIIGIDKFQGGYNAAKLAQEQALLEGPLPVRIVRAAQFHEFVDPLVGWTIQDGVAYVPEMRTQLVAARVVAETLADAAEEPEIENGRITEVAGPQEERLADVAAALFASRGDSIEIRESVAVAASPATRTPRPMRRAPRCPTRARSSPAPASKSGSTRIRKADASRLPWFPGDRPAGARRNRCCAWKAIRHGARNATEEKAWISTRLRPSSPGWLCLSLADRWLGGIGSQRHR